MKITDVPIAEIKVKKNHRQVTEGKVASLVDSIQNIGLQHAIGVTHDFELVHGRHRLEARRSLGWTTIPAVLVDLDDVHRELATLDENLIRYNLSKLEQLKALERRKEIHEILHPETKRGTAGGKAGGRGRKRKATDNLSFANGTAAKTGRSARAVRRDAALGAAISDEVADLLVQTPIADNKSELAKLAKLGPEEQLQAAQMLAASEAKSVDDCFREDVELDAETEVEREDVADAVRTWLTGYTATLAPADVPCMLAAARETLDEIEAQFLMEK